MTMTMMTISKSLITNQITLTKNKSMNKFMLLLFACLMSFLSLAQDDTPKKVASVQLNDMDGNAVNPANLELEGPVIIIFWATHCSTSKLALNTIHDLYVDWQDEIGVHLLAVSVDDTKTIISVPMYVNGMGWEYLVIMDPNGDFKRAMGVNNEPHTFILDKDGNIIYSHNNYAPGDEDEIYDILLKLNASE